MITPEYLEESKIKELKEKFHRKPFPHLEIENLFDEEKLTEVFQALTELQFENKESDLFKLYQTKDLASCEGILKSFRTYLMSEEFISYMEKLTGLKLKRNTIDLAGTLYSDTCFLLCHDDQLDFRKIAFLIYLNDMEDDEGGSLNLFDSENNLPKSVVKKIIPKFNKFAFFEVSKNSFHEVEEVIVDKQRIAIGGWFHDQ
jgi:prolyl 3-hydroxylase /prolyl 3,4-dihydroxylase